MCVVGMLGPLHQLSSRWATLPANADTNLFFPHNWFLNYTRVLVLSEVYAVSWPFLINTKLRKAAVVSCCLFRGKTGVGCCRFNRLWLLRYSAAGEPFSSNQCLKWVETGLQSTTLNMNQRGIIANTHPSLSHISVVLLVQEDLKPRLPPIFAPVRCPFYRAHSLISA